jgi:threonine aldolase
VHTQPGDEVICDALSHVYQYEGGGIAFNAGCSVKLIPGDRGRISAQQVEEAINPNDVHKACSRLVVLENTSNRGGGACYSFKEIEQIAEVCKANGLANHLDGARLWNALVAKEETTLQYGQVFDSVSVCLSKGLGAPVGSVLTGSQDFIRKARRVRKVLGGGMRQAGYLAAACIYALNHHRHRLAVDHNHAGKVALALQKLPWVAEVLPAETNIVLFHTTRNMPAKHWVTKLKEHGILCLPVGLYTIRFVFHLDVSPEQASFVEQTVNILK